MHHGFPTGNIGKLFAALGMGSQNVRQKCTGFPRFTVQMIGQQNGFIAQILRKGRRSFAKLPDTADDLCGHVGKRLGGFMMQQRPCLLTELQVVPFGNGQRIGTGRTVRECRP